jgi:hypothetical protein
VPRFISNKRDSSLLIRPQVYRFQHIENPAIWPIGCNSQGWEHDLMNDTDRVFKSDLVEASGWGLNEEFFVEKTQLFWNDTDSSGDKKTLLHRSLNEGTVIFVRLLASQVSYGQMPTAYRVESIEPMNSYGRCEIELRQLYPRSKVSVRGEIASKHVGSKYSNSEPEGNGTQSEPEEVLHEA